MRASFVLACTLALGCVSSPEVKEASASIGVSMQALQAAQLEFRDAFVSEIDETRALVGRAIVNSAVVEVVETLSQQEAEGDLMAISEAISAQREAYRGLVEAVMAAPPRCDTCDGGVVDSVFLTRANALRGSADALDAAGMAASAAELRARADELAAGGDEVGQYLDFTTLVSLARTRRDVVAGMADFESYVDLLQLMHAQVDQWIATDAKVDGTAVAGLMQRLAASPQESGGDR